MGSTTEGPDLVDDTNPRIGIRPIIDGRRRGIRVIVTGIIILLIPIVSSLIKRQDKQEEKGKEKFYQFLNFIFTIEKDECYK